MKPLFSYVWEYEVNPDYISQFKLLYGIEGEWVKLFKKADGYVGTVLQQDINKPNRFLTIDSWDTKESRDKFKLDYAQEYNDLDRLGDGFTVKENFIGNFNVILS